jgi:hypothetical protein
MPEHRRRRATQRSATTPIGPKGYGAASRLVTRPRKRVAVRRQLPAPATARFQCRVVGGMAPSSSLPLLNDGGTSPSSRRLESGTMAHATDDAGGHGQASMARRAYSTVRRAPRGEKTPLGAMHRRPQQEAGEICGLRLAKHRQRDDQVTSFKKGHQSSSTVDILVG